MYLFKRSKRPGAPYYFKYRERLPNGQVKQRSVSTKTPEHDVAKKVATRILSNIALKAHGIIDAETETYVQAGAMSLEEHLVPGFEMRLKARHSGKNALKNIRTQLNYIREFADYCQLRATRQITAEAMTSFMVHLSENRGFGSRTIGAYVGACKHFTSWLVKHHKLRTDPLASVERPAPNAKRKKVRRMLHPEEWPWLVKATREGASRYGMSGFERSMLYWLAIQTGLRSKELRSLTVGSFELSGASPFVKASSGQTKNRKTAYQFISHDLAENLRQLFHVEHTSSPAFTLPSETEVADMLRADLSQARSIWLAEAEKTPDDRALSQTAGFLLPVNGRGEVLDFHSLRHTCGAWLALAGEQPKVIQSVMRHSTITLTLDTYGHLLDGAEAAAVARAACRSAIPEPLQSPGIESWLGRLDTYLIPSAVRGECVEGATLCEEEVTPDQQEAQKKPWKNQGRVRVSATRCDCSRKYPRKGPKNL